VTEEYIPREKPDLTNLVPGTGKQREAVRRIRNVLAKYLVRGDSKDLDTVALEIWRETRR